MTQEPVKQVRAKRAAKLLVPLALLAGLAAHIFYHYAPRERPAMPDPDGLPARLLASGAFETCFWVPYPHQNLGALAAAVGDWPAWLAAVARSADVPPPDLPSFGPFAVPPATEVAVCADEESHRLSIAAEIYPSIAVIARLAGKLAGNPWLAGGEVEHGKRRSRVTWNGRIWTVQSGAPVALGWTRRVPRQKALAIARLERAYSYLPPGTYLLQRQGRTLALALEESEPPALALPGPAPVLLALAGPEADKPPAALALFDTGEIGPNLRLPSAAVFHPPGTERWSLPGGKLSELLGSGVPHTAAAGWDIRATDAESEARAEALAPVLTRYLSPSPPAEGVAGLRLGLWVQPEPALALAGRIVDFLEKVPIVERRQVRRWKDWRTALAPLSGCDRVLLVSATGPPDAFVLRLEGCKAPAPPSEAARPPDDAAAPRAEEGSRLEGLTG